MGVFYDVNGKMNAGGFGDSQHPFFAHSAVPQRIILTLKISKVAQPNKPQTPNKSHNQTNRMKQINETKRISLKLPNL